jgi:hypothetical protein
MTFHEEDIAEIQPNITSRACGGWLAVSPKWSPLRIGVIAPTKLDAADAFRRALGYWAAVLAN